MAFTKLVAAFHLSPPTTTNQITAMLSCSWNGYWGRRTVLLVQQGALRRNVQIANAADQPALAHIVIKRPTVEQVINVIPDVTERWRDAFGG